MKMVLTAVYDEKAKAFGDCFVSPSKGIAIRGFGDACKNTEGMLAKHPADYKLYFIGDYENEIGKVFCPEIPELLCSAVDFVEVR